MMELQIANKKEPERRIQIVLPDDRELLRKKLVQTGGTEENLEITKAQCYLGCIENLIRPDTRISLLNELAIRLSRLPVLELSETAELCQREAPENFHTIFRLLDRQRIPGHLKTMEVLLPATLQQVQCRKRGQNKGWQSRQLKAAEAAGILDVVNQHLADDLPPETGLRQLAFFLPDDGRLTKKIYAIHPRLVIEDGRLYGRMQCEITEWLTEREQLELRDQLIHLCTFGWGRHFFYEGLELPEGMIKLSFSGVGAEFRKEKQREQKKPALFHPAEIILVDVYPRWLEPEEAEEQGELISLPATFWELQDRLERLHTQKESELFVCFFESLLPELEEHMWPQTEAGKEPGRLSEWNTLAHVLSLLDVFTWQSLAAVLRGRRQEADVSELIQLALKLEKSLVVNDITSDEKLGKFCVENGFLKDVQRRAEQLAPFLDYEAIGKAWREEEEGVYSDLGYIPGLLGMEEVEVPSLPVLGKEEMIQLQFFLATGETLAQFSLPRDIPLLVAGEWPYLLDTAAVVAIDCRVPSLIPVIYEELEQIAEIQSLSRHLAQLEHEGEIVKYKALLELLYDPTLEECIRQAGKLDQYLFYDDCRNPHELGVRLFAQQCRLEFDEEEIQTINFALYGRMMLSRTGAVETSYGYIVPRRERFPE
ncbi:MAG: hypothetical protein ACI3U1_10200 [Peptococcaceae bacterium]